MASHVRLFIFGIHHSFGVACAKSVKPEGVLLFGLCMPSTCQLIKQVLLQPTHSMYTYWTFKLSEVFVTGILTDYHKSFPLVQHSAVVMAGMLPAAKLLFLGLMQRCYMYGVVQARQSKHEAPDARSLYMVSALPLLLKSPFSVKCTPLGCHPVVRH